MSILTSAATVYTGGRLLPESGGRFVAGMDKQIDERLQKLEAHAAHLEHEFEQLNQVVIDQGRTIARLQKELARTSSTVEGIEMERIRANNPKPPHHTI